MTDGVQVGAVAIGKNEGERLRICLESLVGRVDHIVYVDSGSTDGSVALAESLGVEVVALDMSIPFTAARARNAGVKRLREVAPNVGLVQLVDGDCELDAGWIDEARGFLRTHEKVAVVSGHVRERYPDASVYNYLCSVEWDTPVGEASASGGNAFVRFDAFTQVNGFDESLIAGEEPELCVRLRQAGWKIYKLDAEMVLHDAAMTRFGQWWTRARRAGYAYAEGAAMHGAPPERHWVKESRRGVLWGLALPVLAIGGAPFSGGATLGLLLAYPLNVARVAIRLGRNGEPRPWTVAFFLVLAKIPEALGWLRYQRYRRRGKRSEIIEYK